MLNVGLDDVVLLPSLPATIALLSFACGAFREVLIRLRLLGLRLLFFWLIPWQFSAPYLPLLDPNKRICAFRTPWTERKTPSLSSGVILTGRDLFSPACIWWCRESFFIWGVGTL